MSAGAGIRAACLVLGLLGALSSAHGAITCFASVNSVTKGYTSTDTLETVAISGYTVTCNRGVAGDPLSITVEMKADNGMWPSGQNNHARRIASTDQIAYQLYKSAGRAGSDRWSGNQGINVTVTFASAAVFTSAQTGSFQVAAAAGQTAGAAGTYDDTVGVSVYPTTGGNPPAMSSTTFMVRFIKEPTCSFTKPTNVQFAYTSLSPSIVNSTGGAFSVTCSSSLPYTMSLDQTSVTDQALNLSYTLSISPSASGLGTGAADAKSVVGSMAAGQGGTCGTATCNNSLSTNRTRTLTITY